MFSIEIRRQRAVYENTYGTLFDDDVRFNPSGANGRYVRWAWKSPYSVAVLAEFQGSFAVIRTFRHSARQEVYEVPKGFGSRDLSPLQVARMELAEETGLRSLDIRHLGTVQADMAFAAHPMHLFIAHRCISGLSRPEASEVIASVTFVPCADLPSFLRENTPTDAISLLMAEMAVRI